ncbi:MAG TPA: alpha/beta hydrolase [Stellaceae bacterium]|jgi:pimeloyl-ACP methyl ester carboxylesterase|nr:alpha/beta hydrolase [Stellaceae bacterium]
MSGFISAGGHRLEIKKIPGTRADAPTLLFLHEGLGSVALWRDFPDKLAAATGAPALIYSRYGYGKSDRLIGERGVDYMHVEALETLPHLRRKLGLDDVVLVGHSDGASIALIHAGAGRWPVRGLILESPHVFVEDITVASIAEAKTMFETTDMAKRLARYHDDPDGAFWGWNRIWLDPAFRAWNIADYLSGVHCPVLAIQGDDDEYGTPAQLDAIGRGVAGSFEQRVLPNCKHSPHRDQEAATLAAMTEWWQSIVNKIA